MEPPPAQAAGTAVRLPLELQAVNAFVLEEYINTRISQFAPIFAKKLGVQAGSQVISQAVSDSIKAIPSPEYGRVAVENRDLQLVFRHDCLSLGCLDTQCSLCEHNPHRRCNVNFAPKYLVNDVLKAKCEAPIRVEIIDRATGVPVGEDVPDIQLEVCVLDGNAYDAKCLEAGQERDDDLDACALLVNNKSSALLAPGSGGTINSASKVVMQLVRGAALLPEIHVTDSSEAMLSGRKPPFRLLVRATTLEGHRVAIRHAVSEGFVVATRRTRTAGKVEIPNVDDHVSKLEHMGKETVKKLQDIRGSAHQCGIDLSVPDNAINRVGEFRKLALLAEADGHLRQKLQQVLKLSKEKWDDARDHAMRAVVADNRMRIWYADKATMDVGLLFTCRLGNIELERPVGLLQKKSQDGAQTTMEATLMAQQTPSQREQVRQLLPGSVACWWQGGHPGWAIYPLDSEVFLATGALDSTVSVPTESMDPEPPRPGPQTGYPVPPPRAATPPLQDYSRPDSGGPSKRRAVGDSGQPKSVPVQLGTPQDHEDSPFHQPTEEHKRTMRSHTAAANGVPAAAPAQTSRADPEAPVDFRSLPQGSGLPQVSGQLSGYNILVQPSTDLAHFLRQNTAELMSNFSLSKADSEMLGAALATEQTAAAILHEVPGVRQAALTLLDRAAAGPLGHSQGTGGPGSAPKGLDSKAHMPAPTPAAAPA